MPASFLFHDFSREKFHDEGRRERDCHGVVDRSNLSRFRLLTKIEEGEGYNNLKEWIEKSIVLRTKRNNILWNIFRINEEDEEDDNYG